MLLNKSNIIDIIPNKLPNKSHIILNNYLQLASQAYNIIQ